MTPPVEHIGFVGPRGGMSPDQIRGVGRVLSRWVDGGATELHHQDDRTAGDVVDRVDSLCLDLLIVAHPAAGQQRPTMLNADHDLITEPLPADARDAALLAACGRVVGAVPGPQFWDRVPVWQFLARAHAAGRDLAVVGLDGVLLDVAWPAPAGGRR